MKTLSASLIGALMATAFSAGSVYAQGPSAAVASASSAAVPVISCQPAGAQRTTIAQWLVGTWRHVELTRYMGTTKIASEPAKGESVVRFNCDGTWSLDGQDFKSSGTYRWLTNDTIEQKIIESKHPAQRGQASKKRIVADLMKMEMHAVITQDDIARKDQPMKLSTPQQTVQVVSTFQRMGER